MTNADIARSLADMMIEWFAGPDPNDAGDLAHVIEKRLARFTPPAAEAPGQEPVVVKPLEWSSRRQSGFTIHTGKGLGLQYEAAIKAYSPGWIVTLGNAVVFDSADADEDEAKAAAQVDYAQRVRSALVSAPPTYADAEAKGLEELQAWVMAERIALVPLEPDFLPKYSALKAVGKKIRDMLAIRSLASPAPKGET